MSLIHNTYFVRFIIRDENNNRIGFHWRVAKRLKWGQGAVEVAAELFEILKKEYPGKKIDLEKIERVE